MKIPVLFPKIFDYPFTYKSEISESLNSGDFVKAPFGSNEITGVVWPYEQKTEKKFKIKKISKKINVKNLNSSMIEFISWFSKYNLVPLGMSLKMCLLNKDVVEKDYNKEFDKFKIKKSKNKFLLNTEQKKSLIFMRSIGNNYNVTVLEGVAGSGKTLVYFERIKDLIDKGLQALILLPEIALTNQFSRRFKEFFGAEPAIWHSGTTKKNKSINTLLKKAEKKKIDILVATQLLSKGFHFPKLNCIVVVDGDFSSHGYDLRSAEKNMQLYHQLSGRAGREGSTSTIYFQTYTPDDEILLNISKNNPHAFLQKELLLRKEKKLPPFYRLISLIISGKNEQLIMKFAINIKSKLPKKNEVNVLGPVLAPITKLKKKYRCRILIRYPKNLFIQKYLSQFLNKIKIASGIKLEVDVDPINFS